MTKRKVSDVYWETSEIARNALTRLEEMTTGINLTMVIGVKNLLLDNDAEVLKLTHAPAPRASGAQQKGEAE